MFIIQILLIIITGIIMFSFINTVKVFICFINFKKWRSIKGNILSSKKEKDIIDSAAIYKPYIEYEYYIDNIRYISKTIFLTGKIWSSFSSNKVDELCNLFIVGSEVNIYINPRNKKMACIYKGTIQPILFRIVIETFWIALFLYSLLFLEGFKIIQCLK